jgi:hypothetical protein
MAVSSFDRYAGWLSVLAGLTGLGYAVAFVVLKDARLSAVFLTLAPLLSVAGLVAVFERVRSIDSGYATLALAIGAFGSLAASTHGAYDLANVLHPAAGLDAVKDLPFPGDPRGFGTFGLTGIALALLAWLARRTSEVPGWVGPVGLLLGAALVITWLARLIVLDATSLLVLGPALVSGVLSPLFFLALGAWLLGWRRA